MKVSLPVCEMSVSLICYVRETQLVALQGQLKDGVVNALCYQVSFIR